MAAPVFEGLSSGTVTVGNESTSHVVTLPASVAEDDLLVLFISCSLDFDTLSVSGWTRLDQSVINGGISAGAFFAIYYKTAGASESNPTIALGSSGLVSWVCHRYSNAQAGTVSSWSDTIGSTSDNPDPPQPSTPTTSYNFYVAACCFWADNFTVSSYPSGYGSTASQANTLDGLAVAIKLVSTIEDPGAYLLSGSTEHSAFSLTVLGLDTASGSGTVSATGDLVGDGYMEPSGSGTVGGTPDITGDGTTDRAGSGSISASGDLVGDGSSATGGYGTITATGDLSGEGASGVGGYGSISATGSLTGEGYTVYEGSGSVAATGTLAGAGSNGTTGGYGSITATGSLSGVGDTSMSGYGSITALDTLSGTSNTTPRNGGKHMKCCCQAEGGCEFAGGCVPIGQHYCPTTQTAETYIVSMDNEAPLLGTAPNLCCDELWNATLEDPPRLVLYPQSTYACVWEDDWELPCGRMYLYVASATSMRVELELTGGKKIVWSKNNADPLCPNRLNYDASLSDPPTDCQWGSWICVWPNQSCCPDKKYPTTLHVTLVESGSCSCDTTSATNTVTLVEAAPLPGMTHVPPLINGIILTRPDKIRARWIGTLTIGDCGLSGDIELWCYWDFDAESGQSGIFWWFNWVPMGPSPCLEGGPFLPPLPDGPGITCDPFIVTFPGITDLAGCCPGGGPNTTVIFSE